MVPVLFIVVEVHGGAADPVQGVVLEPLLAIGRDDRRLSALAVPLSVLEPLLGLEGATGVLYGREVVVAVPDPVLIPGVEAVVMDDVGDASGWNLIGIPVGVGLDGLDAVVGVGGWRRHVKKIEPGRVFRVFAI